MAIFGDSPIWIYVLAGIFAISLLVPVVTVIRSRKLAGGPGTESQDGLPVGEIIDNPRLLVPHLVELRQRLTKALIALVIFVIISFAFSQPLLTVLTKPIGGLQELEAIEVTEPLSVFMRLSLITGFVLALPYIFAQLWLFIAPGLHENEFRYIYIALPFAILLFVAGASFAYFVMLPVAIPFLVNFMGIPTVPRPANYIKFIVSLVFWVGISFEAPLVVFVLARLGLVTAKGLARRWRYALVIIAVAAAVITPTIDPVNMLLVMTPMAILYLASIGLASLAYRPRKQVS